jgi:deoxycytidylate deaminase
MSIQAEHERDGEKMPIQRRQTGLFAINETDVELLDVEDRKTDELVIGFVGPIGSDISFCANIFSQILKSQFGYAGDTLKVSNIISKNANLLGEPVVVDTDERRTEKLQKQGTSLRKTFGNTYLIEKIVAQINMDRGVNEGLPKSRRHFTIVDSIKHPDEVQRLREIYGETFWLIGIFAPEEVRRSRIVSLGRNENYVMDIFQRDEDEGIKSGQRVRDAMFLADFFIRNDGDNDINLRRTVARFLDVMFALREGRVFNAKSGSFDAKKQSLAIDVLGHSDIRNLIEFSRAVHAEMEAIISVARTGRAGLIGGTLYSTTFPCHSCARHIVAAGIERVIYIEPYTKSLALNLHEDTISIHESDIKKKVIFLQYEGVSPRNMVRLFKDRGQRKKDGKLLLTKRAEAKPVSLAPLDGFEARERLVVARLSKIENAKAIGGKNA